jgi:hypothetical protein
LDHDGKREFIMRPWDPGPPDHNTPLEIYESTSDNSFHLVHVLDLENDPLDLYVPTDAGDIDDDGLADLVVRGRNWFETDPFDYLTRVYESESTDTYPTELVWEVVVPSNLFYLGGLLADADTDGKQEIVVLDAVEVPEIVVYENDGDDSYEQTYSSGTLPGKFNTGDSMEIASDLDGDGRGEILFGGLAAVSGKIVMFESTGDNTYEFVWSWDFDPLMTVWFIVDAGDLDNDGRKEFLVGGKKQRAGSDYSFHVFEAVSDNEFQLVASFVRTDPAGTKWFAVAANVADVDGDGRKEIVFGTTNSVTIYQNTGDNAWEEIWSVSFASADVGPIVSIGAGDHDGDGKDEIIFKGGGLPGGYTAIWEIDPAYQADMDADDVVDVIDNCPMMPNAGQEDADRDTVGDVCDNCIYGPNPTQGPAIFGQDVVAEDQQTFSWPVAADVVYVKGNLADVSTYEVDLVDSLALTNDLTNSSLPASGAGFYYLFRPDCVVGSWQTSLGAEPERDLVLP